MYLAPVYAHEIELLAVWCDKHVCVWISDFLIVDAYATLCDQPATFALALGPTYLYHEINQFMRCAPFNDFFNGHHVNLGMLE
jgi:hypothetical protein